MHSKKPRRSRPTRREFMRDATAVGVGVGALGAASCFPDVGGRWPVTLPACETVYQGELISGDSPVVEVHDPASVLEQVDPEQPETRSIMVIQDDVVVQMLQQLAVELAGTAERPWQALLPGADASTRVGIKVNCLNPRCPTSVAVTRALVDGLKRDLDISGEQILVWDRHMIELEACGFSEEAVGARVLGTIHSMDDLRGPGYEPDHCEIVNGKTTRLSRILTRLTDVTINVPVLKRHIVSGVTAALKNVYGVFDNPGDFHADLSTAMPRIYALTPIRQSFKLVLLDALIAVAIGSTSDDQDSYPRMLALASDALALDHYALELLNKVRAEREQPQPPVQGPMLDWLGEAHRIGLGAARFRATTISRG